MAEKIRNTNRHGMPRLVVAAALIMALSANAAIAASDSTELVRVGAQAIREGRYEGALKMFQSALEKATKRGERLQAHYMMGKAYNRLGKYELALEQLQQSEIVLERLDDAKFELGWAFLGLRMHKKALKSLKAYEQKNPGHAQTSVFIGRAYLGLRKLDEAEKHLKEGVRRNPKLAATAKFYLAMVEYLRGKPELSAGHLQGLIDEHPESPVARSINRLLQEAREKVSPPKPWNIFLSIGGGYDDNVLGKNDDLPLPEDITSEDSAVLDLAFHGSYTWRPSDRDFLTVGYRFDADIYEDKLDDFGLTDQYGYVVHHRKWNDRVTTAFLVADYFTMLDGHSFHNTFSTRPSISFKEADWARTELAYLYSHENRLLDTTPVFDLDGHSHSVSLTQFFTLPNRKTAFRIGYLHTWDDRDSGDYDLRSNRVFAGVRHAFPFKITVDLFYSHAFDRYRELNSFTNFQERRSDDLDYVDFYISRPVNKYLSIYGNFQYTTNDSNIPFFDYERYGATVGFSLLF